jgi:phosphohistidine phosphatase SixA
MRYLIRIGAVLSLTMLPTVAYAQKAVILVRHADRPAEGTDPDPHLTEGGRRRAQALARTLKDAGVTAIVTSNTNRTRETAEPTAMLRPVWRKEIDNGDQHVQKVFDEIRARGDDVVALYAGHTDTLGPLMQRFGHQGPFSLGDDPYDNVFILVPKGPAPTLVRLHYPKE